MATFAQGRAVSELRTALFHGHHLSDGTQNAPEVSWLDCWRESRLIASRGPPPKSCWKSSCAATSAPARCLRRIVLWTPSPQCSTGCYITATFSSAARAAGEPSPKSAEKPNDESKNNKECVRFGCLVSLGNLGKRRYAKSARLYSVRARLPQSSGVYGIPRGVYPNGLPMALASFFFSLGLLVQVRWLLPDGGRRIHFFGPLQALGPFHALVEEGSVDVR